MLRFQRMIVATLATLLGIAGNANATTVNADFSRDVTGGNNPGNNSAPVLYVGTGPAADLGTAWNDLQIDMTGAGDTVAAGTLFENLTASDGTTATTIDIEFTSGFYRAFNSSGAHAVQDDRVFARNGDLATLTIKGLNSGEAYDLFLINSGDFLTTYSVGAGSQSASGNAYDGSWTAGGEYASFAGLLADINGEIAVGIQDGNDPVGGFGVISGIQIVSSVVPEPSSVLLLISGMLGLLLTRRLRRRS